VFWLDQNKLIHTIGNLAQKIGSENESIRKIILFGSLAEKRNIPGSDADILIILNESNKPFWDRITEWIERFSIDFPVEVFPYTVDELDNPLVDEALKRGTVLFER